MFSRNILGMFLYQFVDIYIINKKQKGTKTIAMYFPIYIVTFVWL